MKKPPASASALLDNQQVRSLVAIADAGNFSLAAANLGLSQPTVSQHITKLEAALGVQLLRRNRGVCSLTAEGEALIPKARSLLAAELRCRASVGKAPFTVAASSNIGTFLLPGMIRGFRAGCPDPDVRVAIGTNLDVYRWVESEEAEVGLTEWWDERESVSAFQWREEPLVVITPHNHPWAARGRVTPRELFSTPMIGGEAGTGTASLLRARFKEATRMSVSMTVGSTEAVKRAVVAGLGVSVVMRSAVDNEVAAGQLAAIPVSGGSVRKPLYAIFPHGLAEASPPGKFLAFVRALGKVA